MSIRVDLFSYSSFHTALNITNKNIRPKHMDKNHLKKFLFSFFSNERGDQVRIWFFWSVFVIKLVLFFSMLEDFLIFKVASCSTCNRMSKQESIKLYFFYSWCYSWRRLSKWIFIIRFFFLIQKDKRDPQKSREKKKSLRCMPARHLIYSSKQKKCS